MAITMVPIHRSGMHQRSIQVTSINDAYAEVRRHANKAAGTKLNANTLFHDFGDPIVKFAIIKWRQD